MIKLQFKQDYGVRTKVRGKAYHHGRVIEPVTAGLFVLAFALCAKHADCADTRGGRDRVALVPASLESINIPDIAYRPLTNFSERSDLVLVSRRNEPSPAVRRFVEIARAAGDVAHRLSLSQT